MTQVNLKFYSILIIGMIGLFQIAIHFSMTFVIITIFIPAYYISWNLKNLPFILTWMFWTTLLLFHYPGVSKFMGGDSFAHLLTELTKDQVCGGNTHLMFFFICFIPGTVLIGINIYIDRY